jgi:hypothetical protein
MVGGKRVGTRAMMQAREPLRLEVQSFFRDVTREKRKKRTRIVPVWESPLG